MARNPAPAGPILFDLVAHQHRGRILELLRATDAPASILDHARNVLPGGSVMAWAPRSPARLLGVALVARRGDTATLLCLATTQGGPTPHRLAQAVTLWNQPVDGIANLRAIPDVPPAILGPRWHTDPEGYRYDFPVDDQVVSCAICGRPRVRRQEAREHPGAVCLDCDARAVDRQGLPAAHLQDAARTRVLIDGVACIRDHAPGGWVCRRVRLPPQVLRQRHHGCRDAHAKSPPPSRSPSGPLPPLPPPGLPQEPPRGAALTPPGGAATRQRPPRRRG